MNKILIPVAGILLGIGVGVAWHFLNLSVHEESFVPYKVGDLKDVVADENSGESLPEIELVNGKEHDAGEMELNQTNEFEYIIRNNGRGNLYLRLQSATEGLTVPTFEDEPLLTIEPKSRKFITVQWNPINPAETDFEGRVVVATNDPYQFDLELSVKGKTKVSAAAFPSQVQFTDHAQDSGRDFEFDAVSFTDDPFEVESHQLSDAITREYFELTHQPLEGDQLTAIKNSAGQSARSGYHVKLKMKPGMPVGYFSQRVILKTTLPNQPTIGFGVEGNVTSRLMVKFESGANFDPKRGLVDFGVVAPGEPSNEVKMSMVFRDGLEVPKGLKFLESSSTPENFFLISVGKAEKKSETLTVVPLNVLVRPNAKRANLMGVNLERYGKLVIGDESGKPVAVLYGKVQFLESRD